MEGIERREVTSLMLLLLVMMGILRLISLSSSHVALSSQLQLDVTWKYGWIVYESQASAESCEHPGHSKYSACDAYSNYHGIYHAYSDIPITTITQ